MLGHEEREPRGVVELVAVLVGPQPERVLDPVGDAAEGVPEPVRGGVAPPPLPRVVVEAVAVEVDRGEPAGVEGRVDRGEDVDRAHDVAGGVEVRGRDGGKPRAVGGHPPQERRPLLAQVGHRLEPAVVAGLLEVVAVGEQGVLAQVRVERQAQEAATHRQRWLPRRGLGRVEVRAERLVLQRGVDEEHVGAARPVGPEHAGAEVDPAHGRLDGGGVVVVAGGRVQHDVADGRGLQRRDGGGPLPVEPLVRVEHVGRRRRPEVGRDGLDARGDVADVRLGRVVRDAVRAVARDRRMQQVRGQVGAHGGEVVGAVVRGEHEHAAVEREVVRHAETAVHRQPVAVAAGVDPFRAGTRRVGAALVGHRDLHVGARRRVNPAGERLLEQVVDRLDAEVGDEQPGATGAARVGLGDPPAADVERDGRAAGVGPAERHGVGGPVQQRQPSTRVAGRGPVVGGQPRAADPHLHRQRPVGRDVVEVDADVRDPVRPFDVRDPGRSRVDEVPVPAADHVRRREVGGRREHRVRAQRDRRPGRRLDEDRVADGRAGRHAPDDGLDVPVAAGPSRPARAGRAPRRADAGPSPARRHPRAAEPRTRRRRGDVGCGNGRLRVRHPPIVDQCTVTVSCCGAADQIPTGMRRSRVSSWPTASRTGASGV